MKLMEMRAKVRKELESFPKGDEDQNMFRMVFWTLRMNSLGKKPKYKTKDEVIRAAIKTVRKYKKDFQPKILR